MTTSFSKDLRQGYSQVAGVQCESQLSLLARARDSSNRSPRARNRLLAEILTAYRGGPRELWAPVILDLLAPALIGCLRRLRPEPPGMDEEDIRQQLVFEVLRAAATIPIHPDGRQMKVRLITRAMRSVVRWLQREGRRQGSQSSFDTLDEGLR